MPFDFTRIDTSSFTDNDYQILEFIQSHQLRVTQLTLHELAGQIYTSEATLIRFCQKIGLEGFNELKYLIKQELTEQKASPSLFRDKIDQQINSFNTLLQSIDMKQLKKAVDLICNEHPLYIHGRSLSAVPAKYLYTVLNSLDRRCILIEDLHLINSISRTAQPGATILIVSASAPLETYETIIHSAKQNKSHVILIASNAQSSLIKLVDICLLSNDPSIIHHQTDVNTRIEILSIIQLLIEFASLKLLN